MKIFNGSQRQTHPRELQRVLYLNNQIPTRQYGAQWSALRISNPYVPNKIESARDKSSVYTAPARTCIYAHVSGITTTATSAATVSANVYPVNRFY